MSTLSDVYIRITGPSGCVMLYRIDYATGRDIELAHCTDLLSACTAHRLLTGRLPRFAVPQWR